MTLRAKVLVAPAVLVFSLVACSSTDATTSPIPEVFGLTDACAPVDAVDDHVLVSPGRLEVDQPGQVSAIRFILDEPGSTVAVSQWFGQSGLRAGDLISAAEEEVHEGEPLALTPLADLVADSPGIWVLALKIPRAEPIRVTVAGLEYDLDGHTYRIDDSFVFEVPCPK